MLAGRAKGTPANVKIKFNLIVIYSTFVRIIVISGYDQSVNTFHSLALFPFIRIIFGVVGVRASCVALINILTSAIWLRTIQMSGEDKKPKNETQKKKMKIKNDSRSMAMNTLTFWYHLSLVNRSHNKRVSACLNSCSRSGCVLMILRYFRFS